jgi:hypothetical protein
LGEAGAGELGLAGAGRAAAPGETEGTSLGGRSIGAASKNCALACRGAVATPVFIARRQMAKTSWPPLPALVRTPLIGAVFDCNRGKFKP